MSVYPFIEAEQAGQHGNVAVACRLLEISRAAYYEWSKHVPSRRQASDAELTEKIKKIYEDSRRTYGVPRVHKALAKQGICVGKMRVARIMGDLGLVGRCKRRWKKTTIADPDAEKAANLLKRVFGPGVVELDRVYVGDITYIWTWEGWAYLASVIDLSSRKVVGWSIADNMEASLVCDALKMAIGNRRPEPGFLFHSDRGSQYTSAQFTNLLGEHGGVQSLSRKGQCWDNAVAESWFATLKTELVYRQSWATRAQVRRAVFEFIEVFYNRQRLHSSLGYMSPADYEAMQQTRRQVA
jgi:transposase InsO family protein